VRICKNGEWKEVVVDDYFPCYQGEPAFSKAHDDELWVLILEKAWAKVHGSYERIEAGFAENVLRDLTGAPSEVVHNDDEELFVKIKEGEKRGYLMAASAGSTNASKELLENLGLIGNHSYGILDVRETLNEFEEEIKLIRLRNPWGDFEWNGDWSDDSDLWTPKLKKELGQSNGNDGTFWMC
jgi:calpain-15